MNIETRVYSHIEEFLSSVTDGSYDIENYPDTYNLLFQQLRMVFATTGNPKCTEEAIAIAGQLGLLEGEKGEIWDAIPKTIDNDFVLIGWLQALDWIVNHPDDPPLRKIRMDSFIEKLKEKLYDGYTHEKGVNVSVVNPKETETNFTAEISITARTNEGHSKHIESGVAEYDKEFNFIQIRKE